MDEIINQINDTEIDKDIPVNIKQWVYVKFIVDSDGNYSWRGYTKRNRYEYPTDNDLYVKTWKRLGNAKRDFIRLLK